MQAFISLIKPKPIHVLDRDSVSITINVVAVNLLRARVVFENKKQKAAQLRDNNEFSDRITSDPVNLNPGLNVIKHTVSFILEDSHAFGGAIIGLDIHIEDENGTSISTVKTIIAAIGART